MFIKLAEKPLNTYDIFLQACEAKRGPTADCLTRGSSGKIQFASTLRWIQCLEKCTL